MFEKFLAAVGLLVCLYLLLRMALKPATRRRLDQVLERPGAGLRRAALRALTRVRERFGRTSARALPARSWRTDREQAKRAAEDVIARARRSANGQPPAPGQASGQWDGNVFRPERFRRPRKPH